MSDPVTRLNAALEGRYRKLPEQTDLLPGGKVSWIDEDS